MTALSCGELPDGSQVDLYSLTRGGLELRALNYGGIITSLQVPDRNGAMANVVLGYGSLQSYLPNPAYLGAIIGRCANRIAYGRFD